MSVNREVPRAGPPERCGRLAGCVTSGIRQGLRLRAAWTTDLSNSVSGGGIHFLEEKPGLGACSLVLV